MDTLLGMSFGKKTIVSYRYGISKSTSTFAGHMVLDDLQNCSGMFEKCDTAKHSQLNVKQLVDFVKMDLKKHLNEIDREEDRNAIEPELRRFAIDVFELLVGRKPNG